MRPRVVSAAVSGKARRCTAAWGANETQISNSPRILPATLSHSKSEFLIMIRWPLAGLRVSAQHFADRSGRQLTLARATPAPYSHATRTRPAAGPRLSLVIKEFHGTQRTDASTIITCWSGSRGCSQDQWHKCNVHRITLCSVCSPYLRTPTPRLRHTSGTRAQHSAQEMAGATVVRSSLISAVAPGSFF